MNKERRKSKSTKSKKPRAVNFDVKVINQLKDTRWDYRTAEGIAKAVHVNTKQVKAFLDTDSRVRHSIIKSKNGKDLYTLKARTSKVGDYFKAFRVMNSVKLGDSE